ncbi:hypothetical protein [Microbacterium laevaniformans]|uniref:hypothetical protein n=1 Tax=Microbacterium laevaniformans TaxID=36807 RepID=UPI003636B45E
MGANLVGRVFAYRAVVPVLNPTEFELLTYMALTALDSGQPPIYFDSREASALALGRIVPNAVQPEDPDFDEVDRERTAAFQRVKVAVQGLIALGAIQRVRQGGNGRRAEYAIMLNAPASLSTDEFRKRALKVRRTTLTGVRPTYRLGYGGRTPQGYGERTPYENRGGQGTTGGTTSPNASTSLGPVDGSGRESA